MVQYKVLEDDLNYLRRRAQEEAQRALLISNPIVAAVHRQLAVAYRQRVANLATGAGPLLSASDTAMSRMKRRRADQPQISA